MGNQERVATTTGCVLNQQHGEGDREGKMRQGRAGTSEKERKRVGL